MAQGLADIIGDEDDVMSASRQHSAQSGAQTHVLFGRNEPALHHDDNTYRAAPAWTCCPCSERPLSTPSCEPEMADRSDGRVAGLTWLTGLGPELRA